MSRSRGTEILARQFASERMFSNTGSAARNKIPNAKRSAGQRAYWANMTDEQKAAILARRREVFRATMAKKTPEERELAKWSQNRSEEEKALIIARIKRGNIATWANKTDEEKPALPQSNKNSEEYAAWKEKMVAGKRAVEAGLTEEGKEARFAKWSLTHTAAWANQTDEEREARVKLQSESLKAWWATKSPEERRKITENARGARKAWWARKSPEEKMKFIESFQDGKAEHWALSTADEKAVEADNMYRGGLLHELEKRRSNAGKDA